MISCPQLEAAPHRLRPEQDPIIRGQILKAITGHAYNLGKNHHDL
jgi:hypothetical protein